MPNLAIDQVLGSFGVPKGSPPPRPVMFGPEGTLISFAMPTGRDAYEWTGAWLTSGPVQFVGPDPPVAHITQTLKITGPAGPLLDRLVAAGHATLERIEELDEEVVQLQGRPEPSVRAVWPVRQRAAILRSQIDRAIMAAAQCEGPFSGVFPGFDVAFPTVEAELLRLQRLVVSLQQTISDLLVARNVEESNRIAEVANELARTSNRLAALSNSSNIRMLGLTYLALFLALATAVILFPNTGATILGMPSAGWVPGLWVVVSLVALAVVPAVWVYTRPWVRRIVDDLRNYEAVAKEGLEKLPEISPDAVTGSRASSK